VTSTTVTIVIAPTSLAVRAVVMLLATTMELDATSLVAIASPWDHSTVGYLNLLDGIPPARTTIDPNHGIGAHLKPLS
jgi:hypothetical protein